MQSRRRYAELLVSLLPAGATVVELDSAAVGRPAEAGTVDAIVALDEPHLKRVARRLRRGGLLVGKRRVTLEGPIEQGWTGAPVNFTRVDAADLLELVAEAGLEPLSSEVISEEDESGRPVPYLWFIARKV
jgi:hypothetical protein